MVDITNKLNQVVELIEQGKYFTINRARQYGKTTMLNAIFNRLKEQYYVIDISFKDVDADFFSTTNSFVKGFCGMLCDSLQFQKAPKNMLEILSNNFDNYNLSNIVSELCENADKPIVLLVDEVDKSRDSKVLVYFLNALRSKFLERQRNIDYTFKSVILSSIHDVKSLEVNSENGLSYNNSWNIATDFNVDMSFNPSEISTMLVDYENDYHTGMDIQAISNEIYSYTIDVNSLHFKSDPKIGKTKMEEKDDVA